MATVVCIGPVGLIGCDPSSNKEFVEKRSLIIVEVVALDRVPNAVFLVSSG